MSEGLYPDEGGPAFPTETPDKYFHGMTLRDWFAGQALVQLCVHDEFRSWITKKYGPEEVEGTIAATCYEYADAMIAARKAAPK